MKARVILITDDDDDDRYFLKQAIEKKIAKALVIEARDGQEALQRLSEESATKKVDLVLLDVNMPGMNGIEVLERIRNETPLQHIPAVMISTSDEPNLVSTAYAKGINSYIKKPSKISEYDQIAEAIKVCFLDIAPSL